MIALLLSTALLAAPVLVPFDFDTNQILVRASANGSEPAWFILDTGASANVLDASFAKKLGIKQEAERQSSGAGKGTVKAGLTRGVRYDVGGTSTVAETTYLIDLSGQPAILGREVAGILGYDFFTKFAVEVDYESQVLRLHDPATFKPPPGAEALPFTLDKKTPHVPIQIKVPGQVAVTKTVLVDSGSQDAVDDDVMPQSPIKREVLGGLQRLHALFSRAGATYTLTVKRGAETRQVPLTLREQL